MTMTSDQYDALVKLMRGAPDTPANRAARRVLVDGLSQPDARRETNSTRATVFNTVRRYSDADQLIRAAYIAPLPKNSEHIENMRADHKTRPAMRSESGSLCELPDGATESGYIANSGQSNE